MTDRYDLVIVGHGLGRHGGAREFAATLDLKVAVAERGRVGGDCLWTGCVPSKALLASAKVAHHMRTADGFGLEAVTPTVDRKKVWERIRSIQQQIAATDDNPARFTGDGHGHRLRLRPPHRPRALVWRSATAASRSNPLHPPLAPAAGRSSPAIEGLDEAGYVTSESLFELDRSAGELREHRRRTRSPSRWCRASPASASRSRCSRRATRILPQRRARARRPARRRAPQGGRRPPVQRRDREGHGRGRQEGRARHRGRQARGVGGRRAARRGRARAEHSRSRARGARHRDRRPRVSSSTTADARSVDTVYAAGDIAGRHPVHALGRVRGRACRSRHVLPREGQGRRGACPWCTFTDPELAHAGLTEAEAREQSRWRRRGVARTTSHTTTAPVPTARLAGAVVVITHKKQDRRCARARAGRRRDDPRVRPRDRGRS